MNQSFITAASLLSVIAFPLYAGPDLEEGSKIEAAWGRGWNPGIILEIKRNGWLKVEVEMDNGRKMTPTLPPNKVRVPGSKKPLTGKVTTGKSGKIESKEMRTWRDARGKTILKGRVHDFRRDKVLIQQPNGVCVRKELRELSKRDQEYVRALEKAAKKKWLESD